MPYQLEKGPYFSVTEAVLEDIPRRIDTLVKMRQPEPDLEQMPTLDAASLDRIGEADHTLETRTWHQSRHWYGKNRRADGRWVDQEPFDASTNRTTGYWRNWYGDAEGIVRETYTRAIEVSLGIPHDPTMTDPEQIARTMTRAWMIEIFNRCPAPWFEGWVTWRAHPSTGGLSPGQIDPNGHVTVHLHTPSHDQSAIQTSPIRVPEPGHPEYQDEMHGGTLTSEASRGMWVIAHEVQELVLPTDDEHGPPVATAPAVPAPWFGGTVHSHATIRVVQPSEPDGGVLPDGRAYDPSPFRLRSPG
jgi:hypothetical protein